MGRQMSSLMSLLQKLGQSLMIPVSVLPAAGLVVAAGRGLQAVGAPESLIFQLGQIFYAGGLAVFEQLPVIFAVGVAIGFSRGAGVAGLAAVAGYFTLTSLLRVITEIRGLELAMNTGVFGGIAVGLMAAWLYNRYHETQLHPVLGFFSGKRLVPILTVCATLGLSLLFGFAWPPVQDGINQFGTWIMETQYGGAFYAAGKRLLIPVGLHHVFYQPFLFQFGEFTTATGQIVHGDSARYFAGDPTAGRFMASEFPIMLFGLPAAALAIILRAAPEKRKAIAGVMLSAGLTSIITGITEPIEFAFIFVAPLLYVVHVGLAFTSGFLTQAFDIHLGYTFSASLIDWVLGSFNQKNSFYLWAVVGPVMAGLYFSIFYSLIGVFNFKTPGREDSETTTSLAPQRAPHAVDELAEKILTALGGSANIRSLDACITRLRVTVMNPESIQNDQIRSLGAAGVFNDGRGNLQAVFGTRSELLKDRILTLMAKVPASTPRIASPAKGRIVPLEQVPDRTFADRILGEGLAIEPEEGLITSPFDGTVTQIFKTGHAIGLNGPDGIELLIHVGIDTVKMGGQGFKALVKNGDHVRLGDPLIEFDLEMIRAKAPSVVTPIVITNSDSFHVRSRAEGPIERGQSLLEIQTLPRGTT